MRFKVDESLHVEVADLLRVQGDWRAAVIRYWSGLSAADLLCLRLGRCLWTDPRAESSSFD